MRRLSREVRDVLACPRCHGALEDVERTATAAGGAPAAGEVIGYTCTSCNVTYPIEDGIPVLLADPAREEKAGS